MKYLLKILFSFFWYCCFFGVPLESIVQKTHKTYSQQALEKLAYAQLQSLTRREKIAQLFCVAAVSNTEQKDEVLASALFKSPYRMSQDYIEWLIQEYTIGGILFLFKSTPAQQMIMTAKFQALSKIPLLIAQDCEWGLTMRLDDTVCYPRNMTLGAIQDTSLLYKFGKEIGKQCKAIGVGMNLAPVADVNNNSQNPVINNRSFGENKDNVVRACAAVMQGLQDAGILACAKHFPGHGDTSVDSHIELPVIAHSRKRLEEIELHTFKSIAPTISAIMNAHLSVPALGTQENQPSSLCRAIVTGVLKKELDFKGLIVTDGLGMKAITNYYHPGDIELQAVLAGNDIILAPLDVPRAVYLIEQALRDGQFTEEDLDARVLKILHAKNSIMQGKIPYTIDQAETFITRPKAYALKKQLFENAVTLVKNQCSLLPLNIETLPAVGVVQINGDEHATFAASFESYGDSVFIVNAPKM